MFDQNLFQNTRDDLKRKYIPELRGLFARQAAMPQDIFELEDYELDTNPDYRAYIDAGAAVFNAFQREGGTVEEWNNLFWAIKEDVPALKPDFSP
jgi:hypothetical protein